MKILRQVKLQNENIRKNGFPYLFFFCIDFLYLLNSSMVANLLI